MFYIVSRNKKSYASENILDFLMSIHNLFFKIYNCGENFCKTKKQYILDWKILENWLANSEIYFFHSDFVIRYPFCYLYNKERCNGIDMGNTELDINKILLMQMVT